MKTQIEIDDTYFLNQTQVNYELIQQFIQMRTEDYLVPRELGFEKLQKQGFVFFVTRTKMTIFQPVSRKDVLSTQIDLVSKNALGLTFCIRFFSSSNQIIMESIQLWSLIQMATMRVVDASVLDAIQALSSPWLTSPIQLKKIPSFAQDYTYMQKSKEIPLEDIDRNIHVNNACYIRYIQEVLPSSIDLIEYEINFEKAITMNDNLIIQVHQSNDIFHLVGLISKHHHEHSSFRAIVKFNLMNRNVIR